MSRRVNIIHCIVGSFAALGLHPQPMFTMLYMRQLEAYLFLVLPITCVFLQQVQKMGSVGRSIDVTQFNGYEELRSAIACMFGLEGLLDDPRGSEWKLVYVDYEKDVLLVGDDPWE